MKKILLSLFSICLALNVCAEKLPDNMYFKAMRDEMKRSVKKLRRKEMPAPFFIAYKLENITQPLTAKASFGQLLTSATRDEKLIAYVVVDIGNMQKDSLGYRHNSYSAQYAYAPEYAEDIAKSYEGIRQALWQMTDSGYLFAAELYQQKQGYERTKHTDKKTNLPDMAPAKQAHYVEPIKEKPTYDQAQLQTWVKELSAQGKAKPFLEEYAVSITVVQRDTYYLNNLGGFYQVSEPAVRARAQAKWRTQDGYKKEALREWWYEDLSLKTYEQLTRQTRDFLATVEAASQAVKAEDYLGPVLLMPRAAGQFVYNLLGENLQNLKPILSSNYEVDETSGKFSKQGARVMAAGMNVYDDPTRREIISLDTNTLQRLGGFMPVDDEGVQAQALTLVQEGRLKQIPTTRRSVGETATSSNGHARMTHQEFARERLTNLILEPQQGFTQAELEQKLLARCKQLGLGYGYILYSFPAAGQEILFAQRIYTNGSKEFVHGLLLTDLTTRALRDITAAGQVGHVLHYDPEPLFKGLPNQSVFSPALLVDEVEFSATTQKPDQKPFVPKP